MTETIDMATNAGSAVATDVGLSAIATFCASRDDLLGQHPLVGSAEQARAVCRGAQRAISIFAVTHQRMRRLDAWLDHHGFVTQAAAARRADSVIGALTGREHATDVLRAGVDALIGECPVDAALESSEHDIGGLGPATMPPDTDWICLAVVADGEGGRFARGVAAKAAHGRLSTAAVVSLNEPIEFEGSSRDAWCVELDGLIGLPRPSIAELLADDWAP